MIKDVPMLKHTPMIKHTVIMQMMESVYVLTKEGLQVTVEFQNETTHDNRSPLGCRVKKIFICWRSLGAELQRLKFFLLIKLKEIIVWIYRSVAQCLKAAPWELSMWGRILLRANFLFSLNNWKFLEIFILLKKCFIVPDSLRVGDLKQLPNLKIYIPSDSV